MDVHFIEGQSLLLKEEVFTSKRARAMFAALQWYPYYRLLEAKSFIESDIQYDALLVEVSPELPQSKKHDIRYREPLALCFDHEDRWPPRVQALRRDFPPDVPHLNLVRAGAPRELCLYNEPPDVVRLTWTPPEFLARIAAWLAKTAMGTLHAADQPLEPFLLLSANEVIIPQDLFDAPKPDGKLLVGIPIVRDQQPLRYSVRLLWLPVKEALQQTWICFAFLLQMPPRVHGLIHERPRHLQDLHDLLEREGVVLSVWLRDRLRELYPKHPKPRDRDLLLLVVEIPQQREAGGSVEWLERWAFIVGNSLIQVALAVSAYEKSPEGGYAPLIGSSIDLNPKASALTVIPIEPLRVMSDLIRRDANQFSGIATGTSQRSCVLIGAGALGSQIYLALARMGWGDWTLVDSDTFLPHNTVRHILGDNCVGFYKVRALQWTVEPQLPYNRPREAIPADAMGFTRNQLLAQALKDADLIVDTSTSLAVARALALDVDTKARLVSAFLTPTGKDGVVMIESADRRYRLDVLEQQYYRAIVRDERLGDHLRGHVGKIRYGGSCRDVATVISQDDVLVHAGILAKQIRLGVEQDEPQATLWRLCENGSVERVPIILSPPRSHERGSWRVVYDDALVERCCELRSRKLPKETGGILVGYFDAQRKNIYLVDALPAPPDSQEHTTAFIRGVKGLRASLDSIGEKTARIVHYVGEWHSHPPGVGVEMSSLDRTLLRDIGEEMRFEGWPGVIFIAGDAEQCAIYLETPPGA
ncbi:MAG: ThiF family adenylyltransferase [Acidobacteria bacterium]|nr:ThiF family adenylyltransferase [Acidobacteriota bacterium]